MQTRWINCAKCGQRVTTDVPAGIPVLCESCAKPSDCKCFELDYVRCYCDDACSFCGKWGTWIAPYSVQQFGEPVCVACFNRSMRKDPTND
jgi:hypothetical protein